MKKSVVLAYNELREEINEKIEELRDKAEELDNLRAQAFSNVPGKLLTEEQYEEHEDINAYCYDLLNDLKNAQCDLPRKINSLRFISK